MKNFNLEKILVAGSAILLTVAGLATCNAEDFCVGFVAGSAAIVSVAICTGDDK
ncbi:MAG: hypothetical protein IJ774_05865 [Selenomonadaceae bacterium]|nr:hypothetical protein [Selenomonadaceae bacterium]MBR1805902.1 hypothetical protein [Selenomonadaceae bacterium]